MARVVQDAKGFSKGQVGPAAFSELNSDYLMSSRKLENLIVDNDGSVAVRGRFKQLFAFGDDVKKILSDPMILEKGETKYLFFMVEKADEKRYVIFKDTKATRFSIMRFKAGVYIERPSVSRDDDSVQNLIPIPEAFGPEAFGSDLNFLGFNEMISALETKMVRAEKIGNNIFVFFNGCFPYKIWVEGDLVKSAPYFYGGHKKMFYCFPCGKTNDNLKVKDMVFRKYGSKHSSDRDEDEKLFLNVKNVDWDDNRETGTCDIFFDYGKKKNDDVVDASLASGAKFIGHPISFSIGFRESDDLLDSERSDYMQWPQFLKDVVDSSEDLRELSQEEEPTLNDNNVNDSTNYFTAVAGGIPSDAVSRDFIGFTSTEAFYYKNGDLLKIAFGNLPVLFSVVATFAKDRIDPAITLRKFIYSLYPFLSSGD